MLTNVEVFILSTKKKKPSKKKSAIIEPLYKDQPPNSFKEPLTSVVEQPEFNQILFPLMDLFLILAEEMEKIDPKLAFIRLDQPSEENIQALAKAIDATATRLLQADEGIILDILDTLHALRKRLIKSGERQLIGEVESLIEFLSEEEREEEIARSFLIRELILKHFYIFNEFSSVVEEQLGINIEQAILEGLTDDERLDAIVDDFEKRYPGFIAMTFDAEEFAPEAKTQEEKIFEIFEEGMERVLDGEAILNLFSKEEIEEGAELAKSFYKGLTSKEKEMIQSGIGYFPKSEAFRQEIKRFLEDKLTPKRMDELVQKVENLRNDPENQSLSDFLGTLYLYLKIMDKEAVISIILSFIYAAEAREAFKKSTSLATLLYLYV
jgi:hypothetical protein